MDNFKVLRRQTRQRGLSLLEIMISMVLLVVVITSFAVVYPSGFRLHRMSRASSGAAQATRMMINEFKTLPLTDDQGGLSLGYLAENGYDKNDPVLDGFPKVKLPDGYTLPDEGGIIVTLYDLDGGDANDMGVYASIKITLIYEDTYHTKGEPIEMTIMAGKGWAR